MSGNKHYDMFLIGSTFEEACTVARWILDDKIMPKERHFSRDLTEKFLESFAPTNMTIHAVRATKFLGPDGWMYSYTKLDDAALH